VVITDIKMPGISGLELLSKIRDIDASIQVIMITAFATLETAIGALKMGAKDYITKPFNAIELLARVKSNLRRFTDLGSMIKEEHIFSIGRISLNDRTKQVKADNNIINLTPNEYGILKLLMKNKGRVFSSNEIYENVWDQPAYNVKKIISVHISHIREKLEINPKEPDYLKSVYGMGYRIVGE